MQLTNQKDIELFLNEVDKSFPVPLSDKQNLTDFADKLHRNATLCIKYKDNKIVSMVAGYTENVISNKAYISIVATSANARGNGYASNLIKEFIEISKSKGLEAIHLYAVPGNSKAIEMYKKIGFEEWMIADEERKDDIHLIYYIK